MDIATALILGSIVLVFALLIGALVREAGMLTTGIRKARARSYSAAQAVSSDEARAAWLNAR